MIGIKKILFPLDLAEISQKIVPYVKAMAEKFDAEIHLVFVATLLEEFSSYVPHLSVDQFEKEMVEGAERRMIEFRKDFFKECLNCKSVVLRGDIADEIVGYIKSEGIDLVILGTHGRQGLNRLIFGSVAEKVIKMSPVPVLSINPYHLPA